MKNKSNIVLIGMSGCGKTTVGKMLAQALDMTFIDADEYLEQREGKTVKEIFALYGEQYFRRLEHECLSELAGRHNAVIATGGGAVKSEAAMSCLKDALIIFIKRDIEDIIATADSSVRPLFTDPDAVREMYAARLVLYEKYAKCTVINKSVEQCVKDIVAVAAK